jgi:small nuclear ribonucleoprotein (snRNP)-like protein
MEPSKKPLNFLLKHLNNDLCVRLKNNIKYRRRMVSCDNYMNLVLEDASEYMSDEPTVKYGPLILRGSFILHICVRQPE